MVEVSFALYQETEKRIIRRIVRDALAKGWTVSVNDGEEWTLKESSDEKVILGAMQTTDEDQLMLRENGEKRGWIRLIYGNGEDVICDYSTALDEFVAPINEWIESGLAE